jgi:flagellar hook protein FlgE
MQKTVLICATILIILSAGNCKKSSNNPPAVTGDYQPLTSGSEWNYTVTGTNAGTFKITATSKDSSISGRTYKVFTNSAGANEYYYKSSGDYFRYNKVKELNNELVEILY